jgi:hypothetical protein
MSFGVRKELGGVLRVVEKVFGPVVGVVRKSAEPLVKLWWGRSLVEAAERKSVSKLWRRKRFRRRIHR